MQRLSPRPWLMGTSPAIDAPWKSTQTTVVSSKVTYSLLFVCYLNKTRTTPYRPSSNGQVERYNRVLLQLIQCFIHGDQNTRDEYLQHLAGAIRSAVNRQTGFLANMMMFGREVSQPINLMMGTSANRPHYDNAGKYVQD